ncbi:hypothetical protein JCM10213_005782 [Rhodosporidiobolus nylandii]
MLTQADVVKLLAKQPEPSQVIAFSILHAYVYSKSARGNLPSETLSKLISVQRKLAVRVGNRPSSTSPVSRAFEALKAQLLQVNRKWFAMGALAFGPLGAIGATGGNEDAQWAWTKATDGKVKVFPAGDGGGAMGWMPGEMDAGRVVEPAGVEYPVDPRDPLLAMGGAGDAVAAPPGYDGPPPDQAVVEALNERREQDATGTTVPAGWRDSVDEEGGRERSASLPRDSIDEGAAHLARLRLMKEEKERGESASPSPAPPPIEEEPPARQG